MKLGAKDKVILIMKNDFNRIQNGRVIGFKDGLVKIEPLGKHFQALRNNSKCFFIDPNGDEVSIFIHKRYCDTNNVNQNKSAYI